MKVNPIQPSPTVKPVKNIKESALEKGYKGNDTLHQEAAKYEPSEQQKPVTYKKPEHTYDHATIQRLQKDSEAAYANLRALVEKLLLKQGHTLKTVTDEQWQQIEIDEATRLEAQAMIAPGGAYSPEAVSDRILEFAKAMANGDPSKLDALRGAIEEGFKQAEAILGELPEISKETYKLVTEKFDQLAQEMDPNE